MRLIHKQCGGTIIVDQSVAPMIIEQSRRPGATGSDIYYMLKCSGCGERLDVAPNVETEEE